jgi:hypothetical protein
MPSKPQKYEEVAVNIFMSEATASDLLYCVVFRYGRDCPLVSPSRSGFPGPGFTSIYVEYRIEYIIKAQKLDLIYTFNLEALTFKTNISKM